MKTNLNIFIELSPNQTLPNELNKLHSVSIVLILKYSYHKFWLMNINNKK
jgi:hypothetical protein